MLKYSILKNIYCKMRVEKILLILLGIFVLSSLVSATPQITIHSPQNITYDSNKILANVTSNEPVDFFIKNPKGGSTKDGEDSGKTILAKNVTSFESFVYVKNGSYNFEIWANNLNNEETNSSVIYSSNKSNPINITSCGFLSSSDAKYVLDNDISTAFGSVDFGICLFILNLRNVSLDLNRHTITSDYRSLRILWGSDIEVFNGSMNGSATPISQTSPQVMDLGGTRFKFRDLNISGFVGISSFTLSHAIFENVNINSSIGIWYEPLNDVYFINSSFNWNGVNSESYPRTSAFNAFYDNSEFFLENVTIDDSFPDYQFYLEGTFSDFYLRSTHINMSKIRYPLSLADTRFFTQHLVIINITDQLNLTGASSVRLQDNGILPRKTGIDSRFTTTTNPTSDILIPTEENGVGQEWVTEKLTYAKSSSPAVIEEHEFSNYTILTRGWGSNELTNFTLDLSNLNSTVEINFKINTSVGGTLPQCTIPEMLDLNNDGNVTNQDALIVIRYMTGKNVSFNSVKECEGININPF